MGTSGFTSERSVSSDGLSSWLSFGLSLSSEESGNQSWSIFLGFGMISWGFGRWGDFNGFVEFSGDDGGERSGLSADSKK